MSGTGATQLGDVASFVRGITFKPDDVVPVGSPGSVACMRTKNVQAALDLSDVWGIPASLVKREDQYLEPGDLLVSSANSWNLVGKCCWVPQLPWQATFGGFISVLRGDSSRIEPRYLYHWFSSPRVQATVQSFGQQTTNISNLNIGRCERLSVPVPTLPEQQRIAEILDKADALRARRRAAIAQLDALIRSIFLDMFGDPATNPKGFPIRTLADLYVNQVDGTKCGPFGSALRKDELTSTGIPVWKMDNIDPSGRMVLPFRMWIPENKFKKLESYAAIDGDVIVSRAGTVGKMCVVSTGGARSIISTNLIRLRFGPDLLPRYFVSLMTYCRGRIGRLKTGGDGAFTHMNTNVLDTLKFPYPTLKLQRQFVEHVDTIEMQKSKCRAHLTGLDSLFTALQQHAFQGELPS